MPIRAVTTAQTSPTEASMGVDATSSIAPPRPTRTVAARSSPAPSLVSTSTGSSGSGWPK